MAKRGRKRKHSKFKPNAQTTYNIIGFLWLLLAALSGLSYFQKGTALTSIRLAITEYVGVFGGLFLPLIFGLAGLVFFRIKSSVTRPNVLIGTLLSYLTLISITQNGFIGSSVWSNLSGYISDIGTFVLLFAMFCIGLIVLFNTSVDEVFKFMSDSFNELKKSLVQEKKGKKKPEFLQKLELKIPKKEEFVTDFRKGQPIPSVKKSEIKVPEKIQQNAKTSKESLPSFTLDSKPVTNQPTSTKAWEYPPLSLLGASGGQKADRGDMKQNAQIIERTLDSFGITARVVEVNMGPAVTQYALEIALGIKLSKITALSNDLALALAAPTGQIRIEAPIPGRNLVGIEVPNRSLEFVTLKHMLSSEILKKGKNKLLVALGLDVSGSPVTANIAKMPHVLIAGTTGSGKSVLVNSWICSILYRTTPEEVKLILVDPKRVELTGYNGIPHLLTPVIVEPDQILSALKWATNEMDRRYKLFAEVGVRNIDSYNELSGFQAIPYIVIFIDELADLMAYAPVEVEDTICRIAQMARATGIHLALATQRPSVDVITGLIKANVPSRVAFNVSSMIDSRVIIDMPGAEKLLGKGDMLYIPPDQAKPTRIQGTYVSDQEVQRVVEFLKSRNQPVEYSSEVTSISVGVKKGSGASASGGDDGKDALFEDAVRCVCQYDRASASLLQRRLSIGYARAARIIDQLESEGIIGAGEGSKPRDVLVRDPSVYFAGQQSTSTESPSESQNQTS